MVWILSGFLGIRWRRVSWFLLEGRVRTVRLEGEEAARAERMEGSIAPSVSRRELLVYGDGEDGSNVSLCGNP